MKIHEYQAKQILKRYGVPVPEGRVCVTPDEAYHTALSAGGPVVIKAQVHVGGRGKAGGIKVARNPAEAESIASQILGMDLKGLNVEKILVESAVDIDQEYYLGITVDRAERRNVVMVSAAGGVDIEEVAAETPEKIAKLHITPCMGLMDFHIRHLVFEAGLPKEVINQTTKFLKALYSAYIDSDASLAEINPLVLTKQGDLIAADAKINIDDNALFRHPELEEFKEESEDDEIEAEAHRRDIQYVRLDGEIGIIGNGAGLVLATLDQVKYAGGKPANFLDIGGGARADLVKNSLEVVLMDKKVKGVLINVFAGITRCDEVAAGLLEAMASRKIDLPIVVRITGNEAEAGRKLLANSPLIPVETMHEAAEKIVALTRN